MGNPISPVLADIVMQDLETYALNKLCFDIIFYFRYVDDILLCIPKKLINYTREIFNSYDENLQFTIENSMNNKISFLDIEIIVKNKKIITNWYRKPTYSCKFFNYNSQYPHKNKIAITYSLVDRAIKLSHTYFHNVNHNLIKQFLIINDYPIDLINKYIRLRLRSMDYTNEKTLQREKKLHIVIPYINELNPIISKFFNKYNTEALNNTVNKWNCFIKLVKDVSSKDEKTNVVYRIDCNKCAATYVGQTEIRLNNRVNEHMKKCANKNLGSAIYTHMEELNHKFNFSNVKVLHTRTVIR